MQNPRDSFVIRIPEATKNSYIIATNSPRLNLSTMKIFNRLRKLLMRLLFSLPSRSSSTQRNSEKPEPPKSSCSSYYSSHSHYDEAIADCIEFFNKSAQDHGLFHGEARSSDVMA